MRGIEREMMRSRGRKRECVYEREIEREMRRSRGRKRECVYERDREGDEVIKR